MIIDPAGASSAVRDAHVSAADISPLVRQPQRKFFRRLPVILYRLGFGPLLGVMPLLVLSTRARDGHSLYTPLEFRRHGSRIYVLATGQNARWLQRIHANAAVTVSIGMDAFPAVAQVVTDEGEAVRALFLFRMNAPVPVRWIYWSGRNQGITHPQNFKDAARRYTFVRLERLPGNAMAVRPVPADRVWITALVVALAALLVMLARKR